MTYKLYDAVTALKSFIKATILEGLEDENGNPVVVYDYIPIWHHMRPTDFAAVGFKLTPATFARDGGGLTTMMIPVNFSIGVRLGGEANILKIADQIIGNFEKAERLYFTDWYPTSFATEDLFQDEFGNELHLSVGSLTVTVEVPILMYDYHV